MNQISTEQLLSQIRSLSQHLTPPSQIDAVPASSFGDMLKTTISAVNDAQKLSSELKVGFENGTTDASLAEVMIAAQKADLSFRAVTEVRNKLMTAYQDIMNMPV